jgi:hypothetical protein
MNVGGKSALVTDAKLLRLDVYPDSVACVDDNVPPGSVPLLSSSFRPGEEVKLDVSPGKRTLVLTTFSDDGGTVVMGTGCTTTDLSPGAQVCINLMIVAAPDIAVVVDMASEDLAVCQGDECPCTVAPNDSCPAGQFCDGQMCQVGCKQASDCAGVGPASDGGMPRTVCNTTTHVCVECTSNAECPLGKLCSPSGVCTVGCDATHACPGGLSCCNSLCIDTTNDPAHCGMCNNPCNVGNATTCCASTCTDLNVAVDHCGACGRACSTAGVATRQCNTGSCAPLCNPGRADCNPGATKNDDGCETDTTTTSNCGGCGNVCDTTPGRSSVQACNGDAGTCAYTCTAPFADCVPTAPNINGCETNTNTNATHCGGCGLPCDTAQSNGASCGGGNCSYSGCKPGFGDCTTTAPNRAGCETPTTTTTNCGGCGNTCDNDNQSARSCALDGGAAHCVYTCTGNFIDCNNTPPNTVGCDIDRTTDENNCTGCGIVCDTTNGTPTCNGSTCNNACNSGRADCNTTSPNTGGCECAASTTPPDGGCCTTSCLVQHTTGITNTKLVGATAQTESSRYFSCTTVRNSGTGWDQAHGIRACRAWLGGPGAIGSGTCQQYNCGSQGSGITAVCATKNAGNAATVQCACWVLTGGFAGQAFVDSDVDCQGCSQAGNAWN